jgi:uncharacterized protein (DUF924 family)
VMQTFKRAFSHDPSPECYCTPPRMRDCGAPAALLRDTGDILLTMHRILLLYSIYMHAHVLQDQDYSSTCAHSCSSIYHTTSTDTNAMILRDGVWQITNYR